MLLFSIASTLLSSLLYSLRASFIRDLGGLRISKSSITVLFRLFSLPIIFILIYLSPQSLSITHPTFYFWFSLSVVLNLCFSFYQLRIFQKYSLSDIESQKFVNVLLALIIGYYLFSDFLTFREIVGILILVSSFIVLTVFESRHYPRLDIILYYFAVTVIDIINRQTIKSSSPLTFSLYITIAMIISGLLIGFLRHHQPYLFTDKKINWRLIVMGVFSSFAIVGTSYGYQYLPIGLVTTILSTQTFFSLGLSHFKHGEINLAPKIVASSIAFVGIVTIFL